MTIAQLNQLGREEFVRAVGPVFEQSSWVAAAMWPKRPFADWAGLQAALSETVHAAGETEQVGLLRAHPDFVGRATRTGRSGPGPAGEAAFGPERLTIAEIDRFQKCNTAYRYKFGFPFVTSAKRHDKTAILAGLERRLEHTREQELTVALEEVCQIAGQRLQSLMPARVTSAQLSTQVLDMANGGPARGMTVELWSIRNGIFTQVKSVRTDAGGRPAAPLLSAAEMKPGEYEIIYSVGDYFAAKAAVPAGNPFLDRVPVRFTITDAEASYHVPLLCSPWAYSVCRGN